MATSTAQPWHAPDALRATNRSAKPSLLSARARGMPGRWAVHPLATPCQPSQAAVGWLRSRFWGESAMPKIIGIGGVFIFAHNTELLADWYQRHLGFSLERMVEDDQEVTYWSTT